MITCCVHTLGDLACEQATFAELPCCYNHVPHWTGASFENLRTFVTPRAHRVERINSWFERRIAVRVAKRLGSPLVPVAHAFNLQSGCTTFTLELDDATVLADLLASLGNDRAAELILQFVERLREARSSSTELVS